MNSLKKDILLLAAVAVFTGMLVIGCLYVALIFAH
jgi:hypothetical protein